MSATLTRVYVARLAGTAAFDPNGDQVGKVHDIVVTMPVPGSLPRVLGLVVEVPVRRRIFLPITRVTSIDGGQVITTGVVNMRRFEQRQGETLVLREMLDQDFESEHHRKFRANRSLRDVEPEVNLFLKDLSGADVEDRE